MFVGNRAGERVCTVVLIKLMCSMTVIFERELESRILANKFIYLLSCGTYYKDALKIFGLRGISDHIYENLMEDAKNASEDLKIRIVLCAFTIYERK